MNSGSEVKKAKALKETMDGEKGTEVEMKELVPAEQQEDKDAEKGKTEEKQAEKVADEKNEEKEKKEESKKDEKEEGKKEEDKGKKEDKKEETSEYCKLQTPTEDIYNPVMPSTSKCKGEAEKEEKEITEEEPLYSKLQSPTEDVYNAPLTTSKSKRKKEEEKAKEEDVYCKLKDPSEDIYMSAVTSSTLRQAKEVDRQVRWYKRISAVLAILSVVLLAVVFALAVKLRECHPIRCPVLTKASDYSPSYPCCNKEWFRIENSCYFKSRERLNWQESRTECQRRGGDLAVVNSETVQWKLSLRRGVLFWFGLRYAETEQQWMWIDNTTLSKSYWAHKQPDNDNKDPRHCVLLQGGTNSNNWYTNPCYAISQYICQKS